MENLNKLIKILEKSTNKTYTHKYSVPSLWMEKFDKPAEQIEFNPFQYFLNRTKRILELKNAPSLNMMGKPKVYNMLVRYTTTYDHTSSNLLENLEGQFKQTGTFLKSVALLPYLKCLGIDTIYFLPVTSIGQYGNKGDLGSPYSIRNPYRLDENLAEPMIDMTCEEQFSAFVEAAHLIGIKVIIEFVFRTASLDSDIALEHPEWFYWVIDEEEKITPPHFDKKTLAKIIHKIENNDLTELPPPPKKYIELFQNTPDKVFIENGKICGLTHDNKKVKIPNAFADWPPDDTQPLWSDVTYLKMYNHDEYNYMAYNTIRMYDEDYAEEKNENKELWEFIANIIPYYIDNYGIDGVMIDMGHALPKKLRSEIVRRARLKKSNFILWEENFVINMKSKDDGYDAVLGYLPFDFHFPHNLGILIETFSHKAFAMDFFLTAETHNTKRTASRLGGIEYSKLTWAISSFLPGIKFLHSGFELGETLPINTGLGFDPDEIKALQPEALPLFSRKAMNWLSENNIINFILQVENAIKIIQKNPPFLPMASAYDVTYWKNQNENIIHFIWNKSVLVIVNFSSEKTQADIELPLEAFKFYMLEHFDCKFAADRNNIILEMQPYQVVIALLEEINM